MIKKKQPTGFIEVLTHIYREQGFWSFWNGNYANCLRSGKLSLNNTFWSKAGFYRGVFLYQAVFLFTTPFTFHAHWHHIVQEHISSGRPSKSGGHLQPPQQNRWLLSPTFSNFESSNRRARVSLTPKIFYSPNKGTLGCLRSRFF